MNVSRETILLKMEQELAEAKKAAPGEAERHVYAIKSLCELLIGPETKTQQKAMPPLHVPSAKQPDATSRVQQVVGQQDRIATEDGSNGESIFDF